LASRNPHSTARSARTLPLIAALIAAASLAQQPATPSTPYQPVDPGSEDVGPLRISNRLLPADLRAPTSFEKVYRVPGAASGVPGLDQGDRYARISGGVTALFPHSEYLQLRKGPIVVIPAGTVFYIGGLPRGMLAAPAAAPIGATFASTAASLRVGGLAGAEQHVGRIDLRVHTGEPDGDAFVRIHTRPDAPRPPDNILASDLYRRQRLRQMLMAAVQAGEHAD
jgi:hypothetical protein